MPGPVRQTFKKPKNTKATFSRMLGYLGGYKASMAAVIVCILVSAASNIAGTYMLKPIINECIVPLIGTGSMDFSLLLDRLTLMGAIYAVGLIAMYVYNRIMVNISTSTLAKLRNDMFVHMQKLPIKYFDTRTHGEIMSSYTNDTDAVRQLLSQGIPEFISSGARVIGVFVMMLVISPVLTLVAIGMLVVITLLTGTLGKRSARYFKKRQESLSKANGYIEEMIEGQKVVKVFNHESAVCAEFDDINKQLRDNECKANTWAMMLMPIMNNLSHIQYAITAAAGGLLAVASLIDIGSIASFLQYTRNFSQPIAQLSQQFNAVLSALAGAERIFALIDAPVEEDTGTVTMVNACYEDGVLTECASHTGIWAWKDGSGELTQVRGDVRFDGVTFSYDGEKTVLSDISLYAKPGQKIAFVGSTGAGKTTITNLINRFYDIDSGVITYDGIPVKHIKKDDLRRSLAMVLQDTHLFTGTVRENIRYGRLDATDEEVIASAKLANAHYFISRLPEGYDTMITGDGQNLSQGQRQLLAIARAAVADPPVLILDEATSSIDTRTEALIERGMDRLMKDRTVFVIAHRLSTVRNSNAIMVLENGEIIERGDHDDLIAQRGKYYQLYTGAFELN